MRLLIMMGLCFLSLFVHAATDTYPLNSAADRQRFETLTQELRCPKCQNQSIADSHAPIASDMRAEVHRLVQQGESNEAIMNAMTSRFGEFVRYRPELDKRTFLLWFTPLIVILVGIAAVSVVVIRSRRSRPDDSSVLSAADQARLDEWLADDARNSRDDAARPH